MSNPEQPHPLPPVEHRILQLDEVQAKTGFKRAHLYTLMQKGEFPWCRTDISACGSAVMNTPRIALRMNPDVIARMVIWLWLLGLSVVVMLGFRAVNQLAEQVQSTVESQQVLALETRVAELAASIQALEAKPESVTVAALQDVQQTLRAQLAQIEQGLMVFATVDDVQALRSELEQIKARQAAVRAAPPAPPRRPAKPAVVASQPEPFPYRVVGVELRAGLRSVLVAPAMGEVATNQIQVVLPGDALDSWRLQAIDGNTAVFQSGEQVRRITIPRSE